MSILIVIDNGGYARQYSHVPSDLVTEKVLTLLKSAVDPSKNDHNIALDSVNEMFAETDFDPDYYQDSGYTIDVINGIATWNQFLKHTVLSGEYDWIDAETDPITKVFSVCFD